MSTPTAATWRQLSLICSCTHDLSWTQASAALSVINRIPCGSSTLKPPGKIPGPPVVVFITVQRHFYRHRPGLKSFLFTILNQIRLSYLYALIPGSSEPFTLGWGTRTILLTVLSRSRIAISYASRA